VNAEVLVSVRRMEPGDIAGVVALQAMAFPPPFDPDLLWAEEHLERHLEIFPAGQWVAVHEGLVVGSCSNTRISEPTWRKSATWDEITGGPFLETFDPEGSTLYGLDISVHPEYRRRGIGRSFYERRFQYQRENSLARYGTGCRIPGFLASGLSTAEQYVTEVIRGERQDPTLTPLLSYGLRFIMTKENYMEDAESRNVAAILEWIP